jgi:hypothetical protein
MSMQNIFARVCVRSSKPLQFNNIRFPCQRISRDYDSSKELLLLVQDEVDFAKISAEDSPCLVYLGSHKSSSMEMSNAFNVEIQVEEGEFAESMFSEVKVEHVPIMSRSNLIGNLRLKTSSDPQKVIMMLLDRLLAIHFESNLSAFDGVYSHPNVVPPKSSNWKDCLRLYIPLNCSQAYLKFRFYRDEEFTVIYDGYPKAEYHLLLMPNDISSFREFSVNEFSAEHYELLCRMKDRAHWIISKMGKDVNEFKFGFHSRPSLDYLHLHIIVIFGYCNVETN